MKSIHSKLIVDVEAGKTSADSAFHLIWNAVLSLPPQFRFDTKGYSAGTDWAIKKQNAKEAEYAAKGNGDSKGVLQRCMSHYFSENAVDGYFGLKYGEGVFDPEISLNSENFNDPDLSRIGLPNVGVKSALVPHFPTYNIREPKTNRTHQLIVLLKQDKTWGRESVDAWIVGLAKKDDLLDNVSFSLIMDPRFRAKGTKGGFYGAELVLPVRGLADVRSFAGQCEFSL
jgi:hypothetical protein